MKIEPRDYQIKTRDSIKLNQSNLLVLPIRSGKSLAAKLIIDKYFKEDKVLIIVGRRNIILQFEEYFKDTHTWILAGKEYNHNKTVFLASYQTLMRRDIDLSQFKLLIIDEVNERYKTKTVKELIKTIPTVIGMTGTPLTNTNKLMSGFDNWIQPINMKQMVENSWISPTTFLSFSNTITKYKDELKTKSTGDYTEETVRRVITKSALINRIVTYIEDNKVHLKNKAMVYINFIVNATKVYQELIDKGFTNIFLIHSKRTNKENKTALQQFKDAPYGVIVSVNSLAVGVNIPSANMILYGVLTKIHSLALQILWRASTYLPGKVATVIDFTGQLLGKNAVNPYTDFSKYSNKLSCREECIAELGEYHEDFIDCLDTCGVEESVKCSFDNTNLYQDRTDWVQISGVGCDRINFLWDMKYWSEEVPNSSNLYKYGQCPSCNSIWRYTLKTLEYDPKKLIRTHSEVKTNEVIILVDKLNKKAAVIIKDTQLTRFKVVIHSNPTETLTFLMKYFKDRSFHVYSNIPLPKIVNSIVINSLDEWVQFIDYKTPINLTREVVIHRLIQMVVSAGNKEGSVYYMRKYINRDNEIDILDFIESNPLAEKSDIVRFRQEVLEEVITYRKPVT